jgi:thioredoxin-related protein
MMLMKRLAIGLLAFCALVQLGAAQQLKWRTDLPKAIEEAKAENKLVMVDFTGSDWCGWCIKLDKEVFSQTAFIDYANKNVVPVKIDFPRKLEQSEELKKANRALQQKYNIKGYPTIVVLNSEGKEIGRLGYEPGGPKAFIRSLEKVKGEKQ